MMTCRGIWVRQGSGHQFGISLVPAKGVGMLSVAWCLEDRNDPEDPDDNTMILCGSDTIVNPTAGQAWTPSGTPVNVDANQRCFYEIFIDPVGGKAKATMSIDTHKETFNCESKAFPTIAGEFRLTTFK